MSSTVAPPVEKPVRGFEEVGSGGEGELRGAEFFFEGEEAGLEDDFDDGSGAVGELDDAADVLLDGFVVGGGGRT